MLYKLLARSKAPVQPIKLSLTPELRRALLFSQVLAVGWWLVAVWLGSAQSGIPVWYDQTVTFTQAAWHIADPFRLPNFIYPPWAAIMLAPLGLLPLHLSVLVQICLYFALLTAVIFKFGGNGRVVLIALTSFLALLSGLELNLEWLICLGLLLPPLYSGPFLLVKPQNALGVWLSFSRRQLIGAAGLSTLLVGLSFLIWGFWPPLILERTQHISVNQFFNMAPSALVGWPLAIGVGLLLAWWAFRQRDPILSILAWTCFVPYLAPYSLMLPFALYAIRRPKFLQLVSIIIWVVYGLALIVGALLTRGAM